MNTSIVLRSARLADVPLLERWARQPHVIPATTDDPAAEKAFEDTYWPDELAAQDEHNQYVIAELDGRPIGAMQMIDPHQESTHYWGEIQPGRTEGVRSLGNVLWSGPFRLAISRLSTSVPYDLRAPSLLVD